MAEALLGDASGRPPSEATVSAARRFAERVAELRPYSSFYLERYANVLLRIHNLNPEEDEALAAGVRALQRAVTANPSSTRLQQRLQAVLGG